MRVIGDNEPPPNPAGPAAETPLVNNPVAVGISGQPFAVFKHLIPGPLIIKQDVVHVGYAFPLKHGFVKVQNTPGIYVIDFVTINLSVILSELDGFTLELLGIKIKDIQRREGKTEIIQQQRGVEPVNLNTDNIRHTVSGHYRRNIPG